jgi:hypothetical protein
LATDFGISLFGFSIVCHIGKIYKICVDFILIQTHRPANSDKKALWFYRQSES